MCTTTTQTLTRAQAELFEDPAIESAFVAWILVTNKPKTDDSRKQFLMRIRALVQSGAIAR
jgi:hypothetical protein